MTCHAKDCTHKQRQDATHPHFPCFHLQCNVQQQQQPVHLETINLWKQRLDSWLEYCLWPITDLHQMKYPNWELPPDSGWSHDLTVLQPHELCIRATSNPNPEPFIWTLRAKAIRTSAEHLNHTQIDAHHSDPYWRRGSSRASSADSLIGFLQWVTFVLQKDNQWDWPIWETKKTSEMGCSFTEEYLTLYKQINVLLASNRMYQRNDSTGANQGNSLPLFTSNSKEMPCQRRQQHMLATTIWE
jgi:hypothetical protein